MVILIYSMERDTHFPASALYAIAPSSSDSYLCVEAIARSKVGRLGSPTPSYMTALRPRVLLDIIYTKIFWRLRCTIQLF